MLLWKPLRFGDIDARSTSPLKFLNQISSPQKFKKLGEEEDKGGKINKGDEADLLVNECYH